MRQSARNVGLEEEGGSVGTRVLIVDDDIAALDLIERYLSTQGYEVLRATTTDEAMARMFSDEPKIVLTDLNMPGLNGLDFCRTLRSHEGVGFAYVIVLTAQSDSQTLIQAFDAGADGFIAKPVDKQTLLSWMRSADRMVSLDQGIARRQLEICRLSAEMTIANEKLAEANKKLQVMAVTDELTGAYNRREAMSRLKSLTHAGDRYGQLFSCILLDIDYFKKFNDRHGHAAGDYVLRNVTEIVQRCVRVTDAVCRIGGEEFLIICPFTPIEGALACAEKIRCDIADAVFEVGEAKLNVTVSLGVAQREGREAVDDILHRADEALYASKQAGRNRVTTAEHAVAACG